jgi:hypothetical protein
MIKLFFSYSHKDEQLRNELETHLALLRRQKVISSWHDRRITAGKDLDQSIDFNLETSQIILLLVSANFLASDYCYDREMARAIEKHNDGSALVIPVILHPCDWQSAPFGHLKATPTDGKPVSMYANQHEAFAIVAQDIRQAAKALSTSESTSDAQQLNATTSSGVSREERSSNLRIKHKFVDHERDEYMEDSYEYMASYFSGSLEELSARNSHIKTRFKRMNSTSFVAFVYESGKRIAQCLVWYSERGSVPPAIYYSESGDVQDNSYNESLSVTDDGYTLQLKPLGIQSFGNHGDSVLSQQGAAEYYWSLFIRPLQE